MKKNLFQHVAAVVAATATTLALFSAVSSLADNDRELLLASKSKPTVVAQDSNGSVQR
jgi:hypothetical protein